MCKGGHGGEKGISEPHTIDPLKVPPTPYKLRHGRIFVMDGAYVGTRVHCT